MTKAEELARFLTKLFMCLAGLASIALMYPNACIATREYYPTANHHLLFLFMVTPPVYATHCFLRFLDQRNLSDLFYNKQTELISRTRERLGTLICFLRGFYGLWIYLNANNSTDMEPSLDLSKNFAAISILVLSYVKYIGKSGDSLAVARAVIQHSILAAILAMLDGLHMKSLATALSPVIPSIIVLVTPKMEKLHLDENLEDEGN
uniref:Uncharacterized protein n=1 Tax=Populus alba TaxID=43335 RepID=A0A4U5Q5M0_POPAL|nr:hypothetical protein D5086_0000136050 [Populus alba]